MPKRRSIPARLSSESCPLGASAAKSCWYRFTSITVFAGTFFGSPLANTFNLVYAVHAYTCPHGTPSSGAVCAPGSGGVYDPNSFSGNGTPDNVQGLLGSEGEETLQPGDKGSGSSGRILVPYMNVLGSYRDAFVRAVSSEAIPLSLRSLVRDYFAGLVQTGG